MQKLRLARHLGLPVAGVIALTLAGLATAWSAGMASSPDDKTPDDERHGDDETVSRVIPQAEAEAALEYWTPERMKNAKPG